MTKTSEPVDKKSATDNNQTQGAQSSNEQSAADKKAAADKEAADKKAAEEKEAADKKAAADKEAADKKAAEEKEAADKKAAEEKEAADKKAAEEKEAADKKESESSVKTAAVENTDYFIDKPKPPVTFERDGVNYRLRGQVFHIKGTKITAAELVLPENKAILDKLFEMKSAIIQEVFE